MLSIRFVSRLVRCAAPVLLSFFAFAQGTDPTTSMLSSVYNPGAGFNLTCTVSGPPHNGYPALTGSVTFKDLTEGQSLGPVDLGPSSPVFGSPVVATGGPAESIAAADFNGDGKDDLAVGPEIDNHVYILLGKGDGSFQTPVPITLPNEPYDVVAGKFTSSGNWDLAVTTMSYYANDPGLSILLGDGKGGFTQSFYPLASDPYEGYGSVVTADFNKDGNLDVAVIMRYGGLYVFLGNGDGAFNALPAAASFSGYSIVAATLTSSGYPDLVVNGSAGSYVLLGQGDGAFKIGPNLPALSTLSSVIVAADLNGDGKQDLVLSQAGIGTGPSGIAVLLGNGDGTFQNPVYYYDNARRRTDAPGLMLAGDFLGNGKLDIVTADVDLYSPSLYLGNGDGTFEAAIDTGLPVLALTAGNFSGTGALGLAANVLVNNGYPTYVWPEGPVETASALLDNALFTSLIDQAHQVDCSYSGDTNYAQSTSAAQSLQYQQAATPAFQPAAGTYLGQTNVSITSTSGANIYYTTDGSTPTSASTPYTGPIPLSSSVTVKAIASGTGYADSNVVTAAYTIQLPAAITSPTPGSVLLGPQVTFTWTAGSGATGYIFYLGTTVGGYDITSTGLITATSIEYSALPTNGETIYARLYTVFPNRDEYSVRSDYVLTAEKETPAAITSPAPGSVLSGPQATVSWTPGVGAIGYVLYLGTTAGAYDISSTGVITATSLKYFALPTNGETIYARLYTVFPDHGEYSVRSDYVFTAEKETPAALTSPTPGSVLPGSQVTFSWTAGSGATGCILYLGTTVGAYNISSTGVITATSVKYTTLPTNGETIYARLYTVFPDHGEYSVRSDYVFTAATATAASPR